MTFALLEHSPHRRLSNPQSHVLWEALINSRLLVVICGIRCGSWRARGSFVLSWCCQTAVLMRKATCSGRGAWASDSALAWTAGPRALSATPNAFPIVVTL
jgi:hypothetical protein